MGGDQDDYELLQKTIFNFIDHVQDLEIAEDDFERIKRKTIGNFINSYNSPEVLRILLAVIILKEFVHLI